MIQTHRLDDVATARTRGGTGRVAAASFIDPAALMRIKSLQLRARVVVEGFLSGLHRSPYHGFSVEFTEYRAVLARRRPAVSRLEALRPLRPLLHQAVRGRDEPALLPARRSQPLDGLRLAGVRQGEYAKTAAATIAYFLSLQRDAVGPGDVRRRRSTTTCRPAIGPGTCTG